MLPNDLKTKQILVCQRTPKPCPFSEWAFACLSNSSNCFLGLSNATYLGTLIRKVTVCLINRSTINLRDNQFFPVVLVPPRKSENIVF